jgi:hypothetical protein
MRRPEFLLVRSAYRLALRREHDLDAIATSGSANGERGVWKKIRKLPVIPKVRNFLWKLIKNGLPTNANRRYRHTVLRIMLLARCVGAVRRAGSILRFEETSHFNTVAIL